MTNPCRSYARLSQDKNGEECMRCERRVEYVAALEGRSCSVPMEMSDMGRSRANTQRDDEFLRSNPDMPIAEIAEKLGRTPAGISYRRHLLGIVKSGRKSCRSQDEPQPMVCLHHDTAGPSAPKSPTSIDLGGDLYDRLCQCAQREFRTPEMQALYFIHQGLAAAGGA